jgi:hypothetical protein
MRKEKNFEIFFQWGGHVTSGSHLGFQNPWTTIIFIISILLIEKNNKKH